MNLNLLYFLVISILIFYYFSNKEYFTNEDDIYLKIFRRSHPWSKGLIKNK